MAGKNTAVFGIYANRSAVEEAVDHLRAGGFRNTDVSVLFPENAGTKDFAHEKNTKSPEGATTGGVAGGIAGGVLGWLTGIGVIAVPGVGPLLAAGPIVAFPSMRPSASRAGFGRAAFCFPFTATARSG